MTTFATGHWLVVPILLPLLAAPLQLALERLRPAWQAPLSLVVAAVLVMLTFGFVGVAAADDIGVYLLGNWRAPFGIVLVLDRLAALMLALTAVITLASLLASLKLAGGGPHFHAFFQMQLAGLNGAFLTGDVFNLFVFFEVLLIASYALLLHVGDGRALRAGLHYVVINLIGASLFLIAASLLYGVAGTLNFADLAARLPTLPAWDTGLARAAALLLLTVFAVKAALLPVGFWLPGTYGAAPAPVAALFAIMTKVGIYAIIRLAWTVFGGDAWLSGPGRTALGVLGLATIALGALGTLAARRLVALTASLVLISSGMLVTAAMLGTAALGGALYYLVHTTLTMAALFLVAHAIAGQRGARGDRYGRGPALAQPVLLGLLFLLGAAAAAGLPPLSGFIGKVLMLEASGTGSLAVGFWVAVLGSGLLAVFALARAGSSVFWTTRGPAIGSPMPLGSRAAVAVLALAGLFWVVGAGTAERYAAATAQQLAQPRLYGSAVLGAMPVPSRGATP